VLISSEAIAAKRKQHNDKQRFELEKSKNKVGLELKA